MKPRIRLDQVQELQQQLNQEKMRRETECLLQDAQELEDIYNETYPDDDAQHLETIKRLCNNLSQDFTFSQLYEWQREAAKIVFSDVITNKRAVCFKNHVLNVSTASGKTHLVTLFILASLLKLRRSVIVVVPYIALVDELVARFRNIIKSNSGCGLSSITGLQPLPNFINQRPTLYIITIEKAIPLIRQMIQGYTIHKLGLIVVDEVHVLGEMNSERGAKLELLLTYLRYIQKILYRQNGLQEMYQAISDSLIHGIIFQQGGRFKASYLEKNFNLKQDQRGEKTQQSFGKSYQEYNKDSEIYEHISISNIQDILVGEVPNDVKYQLQKLEMALNELDNRQKLQQTINFGIICLSATLDNAEEFGEWLSAKVYKSTFRQSPLKERFCYQDKLYDIQGFKSGKALGAITINKNLRGKILSQLAAVSMKPLLVFCGTKKECSIYAHQFKDGLIAMELVKRMPVDEVSRKISGNNSTDENIIQALDTVNNTDKQGNNDDSEDIQQKIQDEGPFGESIQLVRASLAHKLSHTGRRYLGELFMYGIAFHNSDLLQADRQLVEEGFKTRILHTIFATTTLAAGVNLPATTVIISGVKLGKSVLDSQHYKQMIGRAGRFVGVPGMSILVIPQSDIQACNMNATQFVDDIQQKHTCRSQLFTENNMTSSVNSLLIMSSELKEKFQDIYSNTLYYVQNKDLVANFDQDESKNTTQVQRDEKQEQLQTKHQQLLDNCLRNLKQTKILSQCNETNRIFLTKYGKSINDSNISITKAYYYYQIIEQINTVGIDVYSDDIVLLLLTQQYDVVYQAFQPGQSFSSNLLQECELKKVMYDDILSLSHLCLQFLEISQCEVSTLALSSVQKHKVKYCIASRLCELKKQIFAVEHGNLDYSDELLKGAASLAGQLSIFLGLQSLNNLKNLVVQQQTRIRQLLQDDITELLQIRNVGVFRARILKQAGFHNAFQIVNEGVEKLRLLVNFGGANEAAVQKIYDGAREVIQKGWGDVQTMQ